MNNKNIKANCDFFIKSVRNNQFETAIEMAKMKIGLTPPIICQGFNTACQTFSTAHLSELHDAFGKKLYIDVNRCEFFKTACLSNRIDNAAYLYKKNPNINQRTMKSIIEIVLQQKMIDMAKWMITNTFHDFTEAMVYIFKFNDLSLVEWYIELNSQQDLTINSYIIFQQCLGWTTKSNSDIREYIITQYQSEDAVHLINISYEKGQIEVLPTIISFFDITELQIDPRFQDQFDVELYKANENFSSTKSSAKN